MISRRPDKSYGQKAVNPTKFAADFDLGVVMSGTTPDPLGQTSVTRTPAWAL